MILQIKKKANLLVRTARMATKLSKTTKEVKQLLLYFLGFVVLVFIITWLSGVAKEPLNPPEASNKSDYPVADKKLGNIPAPVIQSLSIDQSSKALIAKNSSPFPTLPPVAYVYTIKAEREYLGDADTARSAAKILSFPSEETKVINNIMYWETTEKNRVFSYDKAQRLWDYHLNKYPLINSSGFIPNQAEYANMTISLMSRLGIKTELFTPTYGRVDMVQVENNGQFTNQTNNPNASHVSLFKKVLMSKPLLEKNAATYTEVRRYQASSGIVEALLNGDGKTLVNNLWQFRYKQYSYGTDLGIYSLITPLEAFTKLQTRQDGYLYELNLDSSNYFGEPISLNVNEFTLEVNKLKIIYIEPENRLLDQPWTNFLQPYYYFTGTFVTKDQQKGTCAFIVPALTSESYTKLNTP